MHGKTQQSGGRVIVTHHPHRGEREWGMEAGYKTSKPIHSDSCKAPPFIYTSIWGLTFDNNISRFLPPNLPIYPFLLSLKFMTSLSVNSYYVHVSICLYICMFKYNFFSHTCMYAFRAKWKHICHRISKYCAPPWECHWPCSQLSSVVYSSSHRLGAL